MIRQLFHCRKKKQENTLHEKTAKWNERSSLNTLYYLEISIKEILINIKSEKNRFHSLMCNAALVIKLI